MKTNTKLIIVLFLAFRAHAVMAQDYDALEKFVLKYGMKGVVINEGGGCSAECCFPRVTTYFFEDGNCVRQSLDQTEDKVTCFGKWQKKDSIIAIHFTETCYGKGVGNDTYEDYYTCNGVLRYNLYSAVREKIDIHETKLLNNIKEWLYNFDSFLENDDAYSNRKKQKYVAEFASYSFLATDPNEQQKRYGEYYLSLLNKQELKRLRNHIFAKYGQGFNDEELKSYFSRFSWYSSRYVNITAYLTSCDKINIELIKKYEAIAPHSSVPDAPDKVEKIPNVEMVFVKGSTFTMGCTTKDKEDRKCGYDEDAHQEKVKDFYIGKHEITQAQWEAVMGHNPADEKGGDLPVAQVSWYDVQYFIQRLNKLTGKHYRLPTETEWEYACRGGEKSEQYQYSGSNNADDVAWFYENRRNRTNPVGQKKPNELGIYDMNGNVDEICKNQFDRKVQLPEEVTIITRGGNVPNYVSDLRISRRGHIHFNEKSPFTGFRLACD